MTIQEARQLSEVERAQAIQRLDRELRILRFEAVSQQCKQMHLFHDKKRDRARLLTIQSEYRS